MAEGTYPVDLQVERPEKSKRVWALFTVIIPIKPIMLDHQHDRVVHLHDRRHGRVLRQPVGRAVHRQVPGGGGTASW